MSVHKRGKKERTFQTTDKKMSLEGYDTELCQVMLE